jgi:hypothetical protein
LRERYDEVTKVRIRHLSPMRVLTTLFQEHDNYQRDLDNAAAKIKMLQEENEYVLLIITTALPD